MREKNEITIAQCLSKSCTAFNISNINEVKKRNIRMLAEMLLEMQKY